MFSLNKLLSVLLLVFVAGNSHAQDPMPEFIAGKTFTTIGIQTDGQTWQATYTFSKVVDPNKPSVVVNNTVDCKANLFAVEVKPNRVVFKHRLTKGHNICGDLGFVEVANDVALVMPTASYSNLRVMYPKVVKSVLFLQNEHSPTYDEMVAFTQKWSKPEGSIEGNWENSKAWFSSNCSDTMPRENAEWLPHEAKGLLAVWSVPTEEEGALFAIYNPNGTTGGVGPQTNPKPLKLTQLFYWRDGIFIGKNGLAWFDQGEVLLAPQFNAATQQTDLRLQPMGGATSDGVTLTRCR